MGKLKTNKSVAKRFRITKTGKVIKRTNGQAHFNARETGNVRRNKRSDMSLSTTMHKLVKAKVHF